MSCSQRYVAILSPIVMRVEPVLTSLFLKAMRDPEEEGDFMAFEQLMAEATAKKEKDSKHKHKHGKKEEPAAEKEAEKPAAATA